ncbi:MAG: hypothetical protein QOE51_1731 [Actinoplanes sp.]|nr:hypothetical protein [Actinoplanes sp.]
MVPAVDRSSTVAPDEATAAWQAHKFGSPVEVLADRTESSQTFAQPDGTFTFRQSASPQRVRKGESWVPVDTTLVLSGGSVVPKATVLAMRFSGGGSAPLVVVGPAGRQVALSWPSALPAPSLSGDTATYFDVFPGVDLRLTAKVDSFSEVLVVKTAAAAANPQLGRLQFGLTGTGVTVRQDVDGTVQAVDAAGLPVFVSDGAAMWATPAQQAKPSVVVGTPPFNPEAPSVEPLSIPVSLSAQTLTVTPSHDMLTDPATTFPLYIDPGFNGGKEIWTEVSRAKPGTSYWTDTAMRDYMRVGQEWHSSSDDDWRTIVQFDVTKLKHTKIVSASVLTIVYHSADCTASPIDLYRTNAISTSNAVTWNNTKDKWWSKLKEVKATANKHECPKGNDEVEFGDASGSSYPIRGSFQDAADNGYGTITFAFRAPDEGNEMQWKKLVKDSTYLEVNYDNKPGKPSSLSVSPCGPGGCGNPARTSSRKPNLTMSVADADGGSLRYEFEVYDNAKTTQKVKSGTTVTGVAAGKPRSWAPVSSSFPNGLPDGAYQWRGRGCDSYVCGSYSDWFGLTIDTTNPGAPVLDSPLYKRADSTVPDAVPDGYGGPGVVGDLSLKPGVDPVTGKTEAVSSFIWWLVSDGKTHTVKPGSDGTGKDHLQPMKEGPDTVKAYSVDAAGNRTVGDAEYPFKVLPAGGQWVWSFDKGPGVAADSLPVNNRPATPSATGATWSEHGAGFALHLDGTGDVSTQQPVLNTADPAGFTVSAWVRIAPDADPDDAPADPPTGTPSPEPTSGETDGTGGDPSDNGDPTPAPSVMDHPMTAISQDGVQTSMFRLGYRNDLDLDADGVTDRAWCFAVKSADTAGAAETRACSRAYVNQGDWVHLVGIVDQPNHKARLYINGGPGLLRDHDPAQAGVMVETPLASTWAAAGRFAIGRGFDAGPSQHWNGEIDDVHAVPRVWSEAEVKTAAFIDEDGQ